MKKTLTRSLSLLLVLVMIVGMIPMALAAEGSVTVTASPSTVTIGDTVTFTADATAPDGYVVSAYAWSGVASGENQAAAWISDAVGTVSATCTVTFAKAASNTNADDPDTKTKAGSADVTVNDVVELEAVAITGASEVEVGKTIKLTGVLTPSEYVAKDTDWLSTDPDVATVSSNGTVTGQAVGATSIVLLVDGESASHTVNVVAPTAEIKVEPSEVVVAKGKTESIKVSVTPEEYGEDMEVEYDSGDDTIATVSSSGVVTGKKVGSTTISVIVTGVETLGGDVITVPVTVTAGELTCKIETTRVTGKTDTASVTLNPKLDDEPDGTTYTFTKVASRGTVDVDSTGKVTATGPAAIRVKVEATDADGKIIGECTTGASFYVSKSITVTMPKGNTKLDFGIGKDIEESGQLYSKMLGDEQTFSTDTVFFSGLDAAEGSIAGWNAAERSTNTTQLRNLVFSVGTKDNATFSYDVVYGSSEDLPLVKGSVKIEYDAEIGYIEYSGTYNKRLTFGEDNFEKFWDACDMDDDLAYVVIDSLPTAGTEGTLYNHKTSTSTSYKTKLTDHLYFEYVTKDKTDDKYAIDLDLLTFAPLPTKKTTYDVTIPFTAYGEDEDEYVTGHILIHMNEVANDITSRGVFFSTEYDTKNDLTYADQIAEDYEDETDAELGYVVFKLPDPNQAHLYQNIPTSGNTTLVAQGEHLGYKTELYYNTKSSKVYHLEDAALIPAAGFTGKITLSYTAYDEDGENEMDGTIVFNVTAKTKSAVFSDVTTTYSWAADSVDFLSYEGIAQGSNNKYNPKNNITRGDFMLMLYRAFLQEEYGTYNVTSNFSDVTKGNTDYSRETYQAVGVAKYLGIAQGTNNKYNPKANITREEAMALIQRTLDKTDRDLDFTSTAKASSFKDYSSISTWARDAISDLVEHGVIVGSNDKINPKSNITRAEMACILHRVITY